MIWLCFDIGPRIGMGHGVRCRSLGRALRAQGMACGFAVNDPGNGFVSSLAGEGFTIVSRDNIPAGHVLLDLSYSGFVAELSGLVEALKDEGRKVALIDGLADEAYSAGVRADLVITPYFLPEMEPVRAADTHLAGPEYAVLDPAYGEAPPAPDGQGDEVLISIGGSDPWGLTERVLDHWPTGLVPHLVVGGLFTPERVGVLQAQIEQRGGQLYRQPDGLRPLILATELAILGPGLTKYEAAACNRPSVLMSPDGANDVFNAPFAAAGLGAMVSGETGNFTADFDAAIKIVQSLIPLDGRAQIDGAGAERIGAAFNPLMIS